ncbi:MAG: S8 family serine peptidase [Bdellovibrionales bacterium]|nr:S8 family serine peptidase [Bdellovibrionales bacterium]NQZ18363.1 S8 family serine peptidase [Bdellovibrionales bacterium]
MGRILLLGMMCLTGTLAMAGTSFEQGNVKRTKIPGEYIMSFETTQKIRSMSQFATSLDQAGLEFTTMESQGDAKILLSSTQKTFVLFKKVDEKFLNKVGRSALGVKVYPNYRYTGQLRDGDFIPEDVDPKVQDQYHHNTMMNGQAWSVLNDDTNKIVVAVTDDGVDLDHEDLRDNIFTNPNEIAGNGIDDDNNGYIDDVQGWNFVNDNNNPNPGSSWNSHGTHVAGIVAATKDNGVGIAGTASQVALIMPLRFAGGAGGYTSAMVAETYRYAVDNGADIITTSYNIDGFVGDDVVEEALRYVYTNEVIHFNSAGNGYTDSPRRKKFEELLLVCNVHADTGSKTDTKSGSSNYGEGIDICAPGDGAGGILSTLPNDKYGRSSGTSMASPNAAGVAALIWSQNPNWSRDQVVAQLLGTADNIDSLNPEYVNKLGAGRVNSYRALTETMDGPAFERIKELKSGTFDTKPGTMSLRFDRRLDPATVVAENFLLTGPDGTVEVEIDRPYKMGSDYVVLRVGKLKGGSYNINVDSAVVDPFGVSVSGSKSITFDVQ